jgi:hypothetical protein
LLKMTLRSICAIEPKRYQRDDAELVVRSKGRLQKAMVESWRQVSRRLKLYDKAFAALTNGESADAFRGFLADGPDLFREIGGNVGRLEQAVSYWTDRFGVGRIGEAPPEEVLDGLRELLQAQAAVQKVASSAA